LGNFPLFPQAGCPGDELNRCKFPKLDRAVNYTNDSVVARPGYFSLSLNTSVTAEMTVSNHTALYRFTFPSTPVPPYNITGDTESGPLSPLIIADLSDLSDSRINSSASVDSSTGRMRGSGSFLPSFGIGSYVLHFCADFQGANVRETGIFVNNRASPVSRNISVVEDGLNNSPDILPAGVYTWFEAPSNNQILARVGVSFISTDQACSNAEKEIPNFDFNNTESAATDAWANKLSVVSVDATGVNDTLQKVFWSGLYRTMISPQDYTGENPLWESSEPYYDSFYCIWDSFRSIHQAITLFDPYSQIRMVRTLLDIYRHEGHLPDCHMSLCKGFTQGGSNADIVLVDSYLKLANLTADIDWDLAYEAMLADANIEPRYWSVEGRGGLISWETLHYIPADDFDYLGQGLFTRSISRTVEYAYNDYCIAVLASHLNHTSDYERYLPRTLYWRNVFDPTATSTVNTTNGTTNYTGFHQPRFLNSTFGFQDPLYCSPALNFTSCYLNPHGSETYEGPSWLYTFFAPSSMGPLIITLGGDASFISRLQTYHTSPGISYIGDEQAFLTTYLYHHASRPGLSARQIHAYIPSQFNDTLVGIPGNDDSGAMGSFVALSMLGIFPNAGQDYYYITPPFFREVNITNRLTGNVATIRNINFDAGYTNIYVQNVTLNGEIYMKNYIEHDFFVQGGLLELTLGSVESALWGVGTENIPFSLEGTEYSLPL
jgi:predicted alpha-1,2-mannosidase